MTEFASESVCQAVADRLASFMERIRRIEEDLIAVETTLATTRAHLQVDREACAGLVSWLRIHAPERLKQVVEEHDRKVRSSQQNTS